MKWISSKWEKMSELKRGPYELRYPHHQQIHLSKNISKLKKYVTLRAAEAKAEHEKSMKRFNLNRLIKIGLCDKTTRISRSDTAMTKI